MAAHILERQYFFSSSKTLQLAAPVHPSTHTHAHTPTHMHQNPHREASTRGYSLLGSTDKPHARLGILLAKQHPSREVISQG